MVIFKWLLETRRVSTSVSDNRRFSSCSLSISSLLLASPYGSHLNAAHTLKCRDICPMPNQDCINFFWMTVSFLFFIYNVWKFFCICVFEVFNLTWTQEVKYNGKASIWFGARHTTGRKRDQKQMKKEKEDQISLSCLYFPLMITKKGQTICWA